MRCWGVGTRHFIGVAAKEHVDRGVEGGFCMLGHGRRGFVAGLQKGDWLFYYAPRERLDDGARVQAFVAAGRVTDDAPEPVETATGRVWRRRMAYVEGAVIAPVRPLLDRLSFVHDPARWGLAFRGSKREISREDAEVIAGAMGIRLP